MAQAVTGRTFVKLDAELIFDMRLLSKVVLVELRMYNISQSRGNGKRILQSSCAHNVI